MRAIILVLAILVVSVSFIFGETFDYQGPYSDYYSFRNQAIGDNSAMGTNENVTSAIDDNYLNLYTGQHNESFPLYGIKAGNSIEYTLSLEYSGCVWDVASAENYEKQAASFGLGFEMALMSIRVEHGATANIDNDRYILEYDNNTTYLENISDSVFVSEDGKPWKIYRHVATIDSVPCVTGWTILKADGMIYRLGDFNDTSLAQLNATRNIFRYGDFVGYGVTNEDKPYPFQWDLKVIHDVDSLNWIQFHYRQEVDSLFVMDILNSDALGRSVHNYTRASLIDTILSSDSTKVVFQLGSRIDFERRIGINHYEFFSTLKVDAIKIISPTDNQLSTISFEYGYLGSTKLILSSFERESGDETTSLPPTRFEYYTDPNILKNNYSGAYGSIKKVYYPTGSVKEYLYEDVSGQSSNTSLLNIKPWSAGTFDTTSIGTAIPNPFRPRIKIDDNIFIAEFGWKIVAGYWDGYWRTTNLPNVHRGAYMSAAINPDGWFAYLDSTLHKIVINRWESGYWHADTTDTVMGSYANGDVTIITGKDCFFAFETNAEPELFSRGIKRGWYYRWNGQEWTTQKLVEYSEARVLTIMPQVVGDVITFITIEHGLSYSDHQIVIARYDYDNEICHDTTIVYNISGQIFGTYDVAIGSNYISICTGSGVLAWMWDGEEWQEHHIPYSGNRITNAICPLPNGFVWSRSSPEYSYTVIWSEFITPSGFKGIAWNLGSNVYRIGSMRGSTHSLVVDYLNYGSTALYEWNGTNWQWANLVREGGGAGSSVPDFKLFDNSYSILAPTQIKGCRYLGDSTWTSSPYFLSAGYTESIDGYENYIVKSQPLDSVQCGPYHYYVCPQGGLAYSLILYDPFFIGSNYQKYDFSSGARPAGNACDYRGMYIRTWPGSNSTFGVSNMITVFFEENWPFIPEDCCKVDAYIEAFKIIGKSFRGEFPMKAVCSTRTFAYETDDNYIVQDYYYDNGTLDQAGITPRFGKVRVSTPHYADSTPDGYNIVYFYNDGKTVSVADVSDDLTDGDYYGVENGGYHLDGRPFLLYDSSANFQSGDYMDSTVMHYYLYAPYEEYSDIYRTAIEKVYTVKDGLEDSVMYAYDEYNGQVVSTYSTFNTNQILDSTTYAYADTSDTATASAMTEDNAIVQILQKSRYIVDSGGPELLARSGQRYVKQGAWQPIKHFTWRDVSNLSDTLIVDSALEFDSKGRVISILDANGKETSMKYDRFGAMEIAVGRNCRHTDFLVQDFEQIPEDYQQGLGWDNWYLYNTEYGFGRHYEDDAFTGNACWRIADDAEGENNWGPWRTILKDSLTADMYYFSCWVKGNEDVLIYCWINATTDVGLYGFYPDLVDTAWQKIEGIFDLSAIDKDTINSITVQMVLEDNGSDTSQYALFDDFRFHPLDAQVATMVHDSKTGDLIAEMDANNLPLKYEYDEFRRRTGVRNWKDDLVSKTSYHYHYGIGDDSESASAESAFSTEYDTAVVIINLDQTDAQLFWVMKSYVTPADTVKTAAYRIDDTGIDTLIETIFDYSYYPDSFDEEDSLVVSLDAGDTIMLVMEKQYGLAFPVWIRLDYRNIGDEGYTYLPNTIRNIQYHSDESEVTAIQYYDNLDRPIQKRSSNKIDTTEYALVTEAVEYDARGRIIRKYQPYFDLLGDCGVLDFTSSDSVLIEANEYYNGVNAADCDDIPYISYKYYQDVKGRLEESSLPGSVWALDGDHTTTYEYNSADNSFVTTIVDPDSVVYIRVEDKWGLRAIDTAYYTNSASEEEKITTTQTRDPLGRTLSFMIGNGSDTVTTNEYEYNDIGQTVEAGRIDAGEVANYYDRAGNLRFVRDENQVQSGDFTYYKYDAFNRKIEEGICEVDSLFNQTWADTSWFPSETIPDTSGYSIKFNGVYDYDFDMDSSISFGQLVKIHDYYENYYKEFYYYPLEFKDSTAVKLLQISGVKKSIVHEYDALSGRLEKFVFYPYQDTTAARVQDYFYDPAGRLENIRESGISGKPSYNRDYARYRYQADGQFDSLYLASYVHGDTDFCAQVIDYSYNSCGWLTAINDTSLVSSLGYGRGDTCHFGLNLDYTDSGSGYYNGRVAKTASVNSAGGSLKTHQYDYTYNELGWLTEADHLNSLHDREFYYDYLGNRDSVLLGASIFPVRYEYSAANGSSRLLGFDSDTTLRTYDYVGNLLEDNHDTVTTMLYDHRNLLIYARMQQPYPDGPYNRLNMKYDEAGQRILKKYYLYWRTPIGGGEPLKSTSGNGRIPEAVDLGDIATKGPGGGDDYIYGNMKPERHYLYDGDKLIAVFDSGDGEQQYYVNGPNGAIAVYYHNDDDERYYFLKDHLGSTRVMVDDTGTVVEYTNYHPFGARLESWTVYDEPLEFTGKELDKHNTFEYSYFGARYYDADLGRFSTCDPLMDKYPGISPYVYCLNNPIRYIDPDGQKPGDPFRTQQEAAQDFGTIYNDDSIRKNREYFSAIYVYSQGGQQHYTYESPVVGEPDGVTPYYARDDRQYTAGAHTHAAYDPNYDNNIFSSPGGDVAYANNTGLDLYVATPNGSFQKYDPNTTSTTTINTSMPSDPNDPNRQNTNSSTTNTTDDDTRETWDKFVDFVVNLF